MKTELSHIFFFKSTLLFFFPSGSTGHSRTAYYCCYSVTRIKEYFQIALICYWLKQCSCGEHAKRPISETGHGNSFL